MSTNSIQFSPSLFAACNKTELAVALYIQQKLEIKRGYHFAAERIGSCIGKSKRSCARALAKLENLGVIKRTKSRSGRVEIEWIGSDIQAHTEPSTAPVEPSTASVEASGVANNDTFTRKQFEATMAHYYGHVGTARAAFKTYSGGNTWGDLERHIQQRFDPTFVPLSSHPVPEERADLHPANRPRPADIIIKRFSPYYPNVKRVRTWCVRNGINTIREALKTKRQPLFFSELEQAPF